MGQRYPNLPAAINAYTGGVRGRQSALARRLGVERSAITRWKNGEDPEMERIKDVARELGVTVAYLAGDEEAAQTQADLRRIRAFNDAPAAIQAAIDGLLKPFTAPENPQ